MRWDFPEGEEGFEQGEPAGNSTLWWENGRLYIDGHNAWGDAYWRIEFPHGVYSVDGVSTVSLSPHYPGNCFVQPSIWDWNGDRTYSSYHEGQDPAVHTASQSEEIRHIGVQCNIYNNGFYAEWIEIAGFTGLPVIPGYPKVSDIFTSCIQFGSAGSEGIFTCGTQLVAQSTGGIYISNTRLND